MDIGRPKKIIEIEPATLPLPDPSIPIPEFDPTAPSEPAPTPDPVE